MQLSEENILSVSRAIMADPSTPDVREHTLGDDDNPNDTDNGDLNPEVEGAHEGVFRWSNLLLITTEGHVAIVFFAL